MDAGFDLRVMRWRNPFGVDLSKPYVYVVAVEAPMQTFRYVGKGIGVGRMDAYVRNVSRVLAGQTKRPALTRAGAAQRIGNLRYRYVHLVLAVGVLEGWPITHIPLENCSKDEHTAVERARIIEHSCDVNNGPSWDIAEFQALAAQLTATGAGAAGGAHGS